MHYERIVAKIEFFLHSVFSIVIRQVVWGFVRNDAIGHLTLANMPYNLEYSDTMFVALLETNFLVPFFTFSVSPTHFE